MDVRLSTVKKVKDKFSKNNAWTCRGLSNTLNLNYYSVKSVVDYLLKENVIMTLKNSNRGQIYVRKF